MARSAYPSPLKSGRPTGRPGATFPIGAERRTVVPADEAACPREDREEAEGSTLPLMAPEDPPDTAAPPLTSPEQLSSVTAGPLPRLAEAPPGTVLRGAEAPATGPKARIRRPAAT